MFQLVFFLLVQCGFSSSLLFFKRRNLSNKQVAFYSSLFFLLSLIAWAVIVQSMLRNELNAFDLNNDGFFTGTEITTEQQQALKKVSSDTHLRVAPLAAIVYSLLYFLLLLIGLKVFRNEKREGAN